MASKLTSKQSKFIASYQITGNGTQAAINAGYSEKSAPTLACQLLANPKVKAQLEAWKAKKTSECTKDDFVDLALSDYKNLEITEPNKPRFLDIAGKALGYIGPQNIPSVTNNTQINITLTGNETQEQLWAMTRKLLEGNS